VPFDIKETRKRIEQSYIGFSPNTTNIKPVHLANGMFRRLLGTAYDTRCLFQFVFVAKNDGSIPRGHELQKVYDELLHADRLNDGVTSQHVEALRPTLLKIVSADRPSAVSTGGMESYSAGFAGFVSNDRIAQDGGEFLALWLQQHAPPFADLVRATIVEGDDPITVLAQPLLGDPIPARMQIEQPEQIACLRTTAAPSIQQHMAALAGPAVHLARHLEQHPNKLVRLRMAILLGGFLLVRYLADLEQLYVPGRERIRPALLLDFSPDEHPIHLASQLSYVFVCQSITRFYAWLFTDYLTSTFDTSELQRPPSYGTDANAQQLCAEVWEAARTEVQQQDASPWALGQAIYDIIALQSEATPVQYLRQLGIRCGLFWPPYNLYPNKHLAPRQDLLEVLVRSVTSPGDVLDLRELQDRLWATYGIVIGGRTDDLDLLLGQEINQADDVALAQNQAAFAERLRDLSFARLLADGVLEVQIGSSWI
jgi:hypothetical protein